MTLNEIIQDIYACEEDLLVYERKYSILSETFYESYRNGEEPKDDAWVLDWSDWAGTYGIWLRRRRQYQQAMESLKQHTSLTHIIARMAHRESLPVPA